MREIFGGGQFAGACGGGARTVRTDLKKRCVSKTRSRLDSSATSTFCCGPTTSSCSRPCRRMAHLQCLSPASASCEGACRLPRGDQFIERLHVAVSTGDDGSAGSEGDGSGLAARRASHASSAAGATSPPMTLPDSSVAPPRASHSVQQRRSSTARQSRKIAI